VHKNVAEFWYSIEHCDNNILRLRETWIDPYLGGNIWFVRGSIRSLVIDTGTGMLSPASILNTCANQPLLAVACNGWYDHAGGLHFFSERACHVLEENLISNPSKESSAVSVYVSEDMLSALPCDGFNLGAYRMQGMKPTITFEDGATIDLGNRQFEIIHVPGMTPGSIALWEASTGSLFTSDTLYDDPFAADRGDEPEAPVTYDEDQHKVSLLRLRALPVVTVYPGHFSCFGRARMLEIIDEILEL
jgi:glyoxylase-like metal-dependent hydrolase (beta-lactamase superfamily II)